MKYMGSKNRIAKHILPIMLNQANAKNIKTWVEPFVGGGNTIDKVPPSFERIGFDINPHAIQALQGIRDLVDILPEYVSEEYYKSLKGSKPDPITSLIRFGASFGGKFEAGFARGRNNNGKIRDYWGETLRNARKQSAALQGVVLYNYDYNMASIYKDCVIYCDPPYKETTSYATGKFDHSKFWDWCREMSENNLIFVSEYKAPDDFSCLWEGNVKTTFASQRTKATNNATERLFTYGI